MRDRSIATLGPIVRGLLAVGLCTLAAAAQQPAAPAAPADATALTHASAENAKEKPAAAPAADSSSDASNTGIANPDQAMPNGGADATGPAANAEPSQNPAIHDSPVFSPDQPQRPLAPDHDSDTPAPLDPPAPPSSAETIVAPPTGPAASSTPAPEVTVPPQAPPATPDNPNSSVAPVSTSPEATAPQQSEPAPLATDSSAVPPQQNVPATPDNAAPPVTTAAPTPAADGTETSASQQSAPATPPASPDQTQAAPPAPDAAAAPSATPAATPAAPGNAPVSTVPAPDASAPAPDASAPVTAPQDQTPSAPTVPSAPAAQDNQAVNPSLPGEQVNEEEPPPSSRIDIFGGYTFLYSSGQVGTWSFPTKNTRGYSASASYFFTHHFGVQAEFSHSEYPLGTTGTSPAPPFVQLGGITDSFYTVEAGPVYRFFPNEHIIPFVHFTGGGAKVAGPKFQPATWGYGFSGGGGVDVLLPHTHEHMAFRLVQADFGYMHADQGALQQYDLAGGTQIVSGVRLSTGLVVRFGEMNPKQSKSLACDATPSEVYAGERVTLAATLRNYRDKNKHPFFFAWELSAGKQQGFGPVIFVDTTGLAAGTYHATAHIALKEKGKQFAQCGTDFVVKESPAPTVKCSADPSTVTPGQVSIITAYASTIAQRQLTYTYTTSEGQINGKDNTAELHTDGLPPGVATVTCKVLDDLGQTAVANTEVTIAPPSLPPAPKAQPLCTVYFNRDMRRPARVDNEGRACLDDIALTMEHQPDARLVLVGEHSDSEVDGQLTAAERAMNTRAYLANEKGIDPSRVDVRTSTTPGRQVQTYLLSPGAVFDQPTEGQIDESKIKIHGQQYAHQRVRAPQKGPVGQGVSHPPKN